MFVLDTCFSFKLIFCFVLFFETDYSDVEDVGDENTCALCLWEQAENRKYKRKQQKKRRKERKRIAKTLCPASA